jgi:hypothetical protein
MDIKQQKAPSGAFFVLYPLLLPPLKGREEKVDLLIYIIRCKRREKHIVCKTLLIPVKKRLAGRRIVLCRVLHKTRKMCR